MINCVQRYGKKFTLICFLFFVTHLCNDAGGYGARNTENTENTEKHFTYQTCETNLLEASLESVVTFDYE